MNPSSGSRVVASHSIARRAFAAAGVFGAVAAIWAIVVLVRGGSWWGPLHAFLAGTVLLAISGAATMFTITWAAASPPTARVSTSQRLLVAIGTGLVLIGVSATIPILVWAGAGAIAAGLVILGFTIVGAVRRSLLRRFDLSARFYLTAFACGVAGTALGAFLGTAAAGDSFADWRLAHSHLNLIGLVGFTIIGTIPTFLPTVTHHRAVSGREAIVAWWLCMAAGVAMAVGAELGAGWVGAGGIATAVAAALVLGGILGRLWAKGRSKLQFLQVSVGVVWLIGWTAADGVSLIAQGSFAPFQTSTAAVVLAGVGQVLLGSLAYLVPVLKGPPLSENFDRLTRHPWIPLGAANLAGIALLAGWNRPAQVLVAIWLVDFLRRLIAVLGSSPDR